MQITKLQESTPGGQWIDKMGGRKYKYISYEKETRCKRERRASKYNRLKHIPTAIPI